MTTYSNKTASVTRGLDRRSVLRGLDITLAILLAGTILPLPGGADAIHCVSGILLLVGCGVHLAFHWRWIRAVILETPTNITPALRRQRRQFWGLSISGFLCGISGMAMLPFAIGLFGLLPHLLLCFIPIHALSGLVFLGMGVYHLVSHRNWLMCRAQKKKLIIE